MVGHVTFRTAMSKMLSDTYVATCDNIIEDYCCLLYTSRCV